MHSPPVVLSIAGSDCSAGAGLQADLKTCATMGVHCLTAVTAVVAETPVKVSSIQAMSPELVCEQVALLLQGYPVNAIKTGMLGSAAQIEALADLLAKEQAPLVVDPVLVASTGDSLSSDDAVEAYQSRLIPVARVVTPNFPEACALLGVDEVEGLSPRDLAEALAERFQVDILLTGGHAEGRDRATDILVERGMTHILRGDWIDCPSSHGTGCTLSAALSAGLASGMHLLDAASQAKEFVTRALRDHYTWPDSPGLLALNQLPNKNLFDQGD